MQQYIVFYTCSSHPSDTLSQFIVSAESPEHARQKAQDELDSVCEGWHQIDSVQPYNGPQ